MDNPTASGGSNAGAGSSAAASDEGRPIVFRGVTIGYAQRPDIRSTDEGYYGLWKDFKGDLPIEEQIAARHVRAIMSISNLLNRET
ncbi:uncharacterized protein EAE97_008349 [Botrytis byssoidea]|uniref:Uncharacterized protein n=2 Tax=Sclerotiniaceae TaxID=28983 RepID=A0A4Z1HJW7_9HELO|nr:uncharacterized protein EAE97_008349 [Botrytis byssoidea]KAF7935442.1 hypothetical protein EAE97_008349 [Botrytis byssoidea]TGO49376.1 hypothetical protein BOTNAR_0433g00030 [Botryotinia narcissicola]